MVVLGPGNVGKSRLLAVLQDDKYEEQSTNGAVTSTLQLNRRDLKIGQGKLFAKHEAGVSQVEQAIAAQAALAAEADEAGKGGDGRDMLTESIIRKRDDAPPDDYRHPPADASASHSLAGDGRAADGGGKAIDAAPRQQPPSAPQVASPVVAVERTEHIQANAKKLLESGEAGCKVSARARHGCMLPG